MEAVLLDFLHRLEAIGDGHEEIFDTVVRDAMGDAVFNGFIKPIPDFVLRDEFGMYTEETNALIRDALAWFIAVANQTCREEGRITFHQRLAAFQNLNVRTESTNDYNDFFGWWNPAQFDEDGNVKDR